MKRSAIALARARPCCLRRARRGSRGAVLLAARGGAALQLFARHFFIADLGDFLPCLRFLALGRSLVFLGRTELLAMSLPGFLFLGLLLGCLLELLKTAIEEVGGDRDISDERRGRGHAATFGAVLDQATQRPRRVDLGPTEPDARIV